jgi:hypothetical protein
MIQLAIFLFLQHITIYTVICFGILGFIIGFFIRTNGLAKRKRKLRSLQNEADINKARIESLEKKANELKNNNSGEKNK